MTECYWKEWFWRWWRSQERAAFVWAWIWDQRKCGRTWRDGVGLRKLHTHPDNSFWTHRSVLIARSTFCSQNSLNVDCPDLIPSNSAVALCSGSDCPRGRHFCFVPGVCRGTEHSQQQGLAPCAVLLSVGETIPFAPCEFKLYPCAMNSMN